MIDRGLYPELAYRLCLKMCDYLQKTKKIEILQMKAEFLRDVNNTVWFVYAKDIHIRPVKEKDYSKDIFHTVKVTEEKLRKVKLREKDVLEEEMRSFQQQLEASKSSAERPDHKSTLYEQMASHYAQLRHTYEVDSLFV